LKETLLGLFVAVVLSPGYHPANAQSYLPFPTDSATWNVARCWYLFLPG
jgi:hypothetical protein